MMLDRLFLPFLALVAVGAIALSLVWPQGLGDRSPGPFGQMPVQRRPEVQAAMQREALAAQRRDAQARSAIRELQEAAVAPAP